MKILAIDIGGTHVKVLLSGEEIPRKFESGPSLTAKKMVVGVKVITRDWNYDVVSLGYPGPVLQSRPVLEPHNLAGGWVGFDYQRAFGKPVKILNDAAMQALGSYKKGKMLFLGLGTGLGTCMVVDGMVEPMELGHFPYKGATIEDYVGIRAMEARGKKKWRRDVADVVQYLISALEPDDVVLGGGNSKELKECPPHCRLGDNSYAFVGGFRLWDKTSGKQTAARKPAKRD